MLITPVPEIANLKRPAAAAMGGTGAGVAPRPLSLNGSAVTTGSQVMVTLTCSGVPPPARDYTGVLPPRATRAVGVDVLLDAAVGEWTRVGYDLESGVLFVDQSHTNAHEPTLSDGGLHCTTAQHYDDRPDCLTCLHCLWQWCSSCTQCCAEFWVLTGDCVCCRCCCCCCRWYSVSDNCATCISDGRPNARPQHHCPCRRRTAGVLCEQPRGHLLASFAVSKQIERTGGAAGTRVRLRGSGVGLGVRRQSVGTGDNRPGTLEWLSCRSQSRQPWFIRN